MKFLRLFRAVLREIFDESAYERFCAEEQLPHDRGSYLAFLRRKHQSPKIRCC